MRLPFALLLASSALLFTGCSAAPGFHSTSAVPGSVRGPVLQGKVHGGQSPITGAKVYLYAVSTSGYGGASTSLLNSPGYVTTDASGNFSIASDYNCSSGQQVYIYSVGGNPGLESGTDNTSAGLLAGLGSCTQLQSFPPFIFVDEVSTVATAYALAGYATDATDISSSSSALAATGVANAFASITNLESLTVGTAFSTTPAANGGNGTVPQSEIDTLANILAACVNTAGSTATGQPCNTLFTNALSGGSTGTQPADTAAAAINIAHNPGANIGNLFALQAGSAPFIPDLGTAPNDFTIALNYTDPSIDYTQSVTVDASGNVWVAEQNGNTISKFSPVGKPLSGASGFTTTGFDSVTFAAIDSEGNAWASSTTNLFEFGSTGSLLSPVAGWPGGGLDSPDDIAIDPSKNIWATNPNDNTVSELNSSGSPLSGTGYAAASFNGPVYIASDVSGNIWVANNGGTTITELNPNGSEATNSPFSGGGIDNPEALAFDPTGNLWITNPTGVSELNSAGSPVSMTGYSGGGLNSPTGIALDSNGNAWVANGLGNSITELNPAGSQITGSNGYIGGALSEPADIAVDGSGNIWIGNVGTNSITEFIGLAAPVVTPLGANLTSPYGSKAVNLP